MKTFKRLMWVAAGLVLSLTAAVILSLCCNNAPTHPAGQIHEEEYGVQGSSSTAAETITYWQDGEKKTCLADSIHHLGYWQWHSTPINDISVGMRVELTNGGLARGQDYCSGIVKWIDRRSSKDYWMIYYTSDQTGEVEWKIEPWLREKPPTDTTGGDTMATPSDVVYRVLPDTGGVE
jgi:hypothetical protein